MSDRQETVGDRARTVAERIATLHQQVRASFQVADVTERMNKLQNVGVEIVFDLMPVFSWLERKKPPDKVQLLQSRLNALFCHAIACAGRDIPEYTNKHVAPNAGGLSDGAIAVGELLVAAKLVAAHLVDWGNEIDAEDGNPKQETVGNCIHLHTEVWHIRYEGESGTYPATGNMSIGWIAKLIAAPNRSLTVADVRGDPEGKLAADARMCGERETDHQGVTSILKRLQEIDDISAETGGCESLEEERIDLLERLKSADDGKQLLTALKKAHHNIATQIRTFIREKLVKDMPFLAAHLTLALKLDFPHFGYFPPVGTPAWKI